MNEIYSFVWLSVGPSLKSIDSGSRPDRVGIFCQKYNSTQIGRVLLTTCICNQKLSRESMGNGGKRCQRQRARERGRWVNRRNRISQKPCYVYLRNFLCTLIHIKLKRGNFLYIFSFLNLHSEDTYLSLLHPLSHLLFCHPSLSPPPSFPFFTLSLYIPLYLTPPLSITPSLSFSLSPPLYLPLTTISISPPHLHEGTLTDLASEQINTYNITELENIINFLSL